jgi:hypothetical protein
MAALGHVHTATSVVRKNVVRFFCRTTFWITELDCITHFSLRQSDGCRTVDVACRHVWKLRLHFTFYYLMRHESYGRRTTDVAVCERALLDTRSSFNSYYFFLHNTSCGSTHVTKDKQITSHWRASVTTLTPDNIYYVCLSRETTDTFVIWAWGYIFLCNFMLITN